MQGIEVEAIYDHGMLKLARELPLEQGQKVTVLVSTDKRSGSWKGTTEDLNHLIMSDENDPLEAS